MLTKRGLAAVSVILAHSSYLKVIPFDWVIDGTRHVKVVTDTRLLTPIFFGVWITILATFQVVTCLFRRGSMSLGQQVLSTLFATVFSLGAGVSWNTIWKRREFATFSNHFYSLQKLLTDGYVIGKGDEFDGFGLLLGTMLTVRFTQSSVSSLLFLLEPDSPRYLYALCQGYLPPYSLLIFWAIEWWSYVLLWHIFLPSFVLFLAYTHSTANWLQQMTLRYSAGDKLETSHRLRIRATSLKIYQMLLLLNVEFNGVFSSLLLPWLYSIIILTPATGNFLLLKKRTEAGLTALLSTSIMSTVSVSVIILVAFRKAAQVNTLSRKFLGMAGGRESKAFPPIRIEIGGFGYFRNGSVLRTITQIITVTLALLLLIE